MTNFRRTIEKQRLWYGSLSRPLLQQLAELHRITIRDFAGIFGISKGHAEDILKHRKLPSLELAFRIARYYEVSVDELFGWRVDDTGERKPLVIETSKGPVRLHRENDKGGILNMIEEGLRKQ